MFTFLSEEVGKRLPLASIEACLRNFCRPWGGRGISSAHLHACRDKEGTSRHSGKYFTVLARAPQFGPKNKGGLPIFYIYHEYTIKIPSIDTKSQQRRSSWTFNPVRSRTLIFDTQQERCCGGSDGSEESIFLGLRKGKFSSNDNVF